MIQVGNILKENRKLKNLSLEEVSHELKISQYILLKIEENNIQKDKDIIFYIGHIRSYSNFLDLETSEIISIFKKQISFQKPSIADNIQKPDLINKNVKIKKYIPYSLIIIIFSTFYFLFIQNSNKSPQYALVPELPEKYIPIIEQIETEGNIKEMNNSLNIAQESITNSSSAVASIDLSSINSNNIVTLKFLNSTWLQLRDTSDRIILSKLMEKDEEYSYDLSLNYNITAGNGGNILVIIDKNVRGKIGRYGEIIDSYILDKNFNN